MITKVPVYIRIAAVAAVLLLVYYLRDVLLPFAVAFLLAYILNPVVEFLTKGLRKRWLAVIVTLVLCLAIFTGISLLIVPKLYDEVRHLYTLLNERSAISNWRESLPDFVVQYVEQIGNDEGLASIMKSDNLGAIAETVFSKVTQLLGSTFNIVSSVVGSAIIILYLIFIMLDFNEISIGIRNMIPARYRQKSMKFFNRFTSEMRNYFRGQIIIVMIVTVMYTIGFSIVGLPLGIMLGLMVGALNIVPYLQIAGFLPALLLCFVKSVETGNPVWAVILSVAAVFVTVQILQDGFITPKIMGKTTGLNPAMILLSLSIWGKLMGFLGLIVAIPFSCLVKTYYSEYIKKIDGESPKHENDDDKSKETDSD